jgi:glycosyltransferase involved in cell wall biosynthesis
VKVAYLTTVDLSLRFLVLAQLTALRDEGHDVIGISAPGPWVADLEREGIRHVRLGSSTRAMDLGADARSARELWHVLRRERPDVLHTHTPKAGVYGRVVGRLAGVPVVVNTVHGLYATPSDRAAKRLAVYALEALAARFSDAELVLNPEDFDLMRRTGITRRARLVGGGVDLMRFDPDRVTDAERDDLRAALGVGAGQVLVGAVGRLVAEKGYPELFDAFRRLDPERYTLVVAGADDPDKHDALPPGTLARARADGVRLLGQYDDMDTLYKAMDLFVLASHREGLPLAGMEAAAMGLPVVMTDVRGCRQIVEPGRTGLLVPVGDAPVLAAAISKLGDDPELRAEMGAAGRALAQSEFDERQVARVSLDTYREVAARKGIPRERVDVLQVVTSDDRRGPETHAVELGVALERRGHRVRTVALAPGPHGGGLDVSTLGTRPRAISTLRRLRREAASAAVVIAHGSTTLSASVAAGAGLGVPLVYRSIGDPEQWTRTAARRGRVRAFLRRVQSVVALTPGGAATIQSRYHVSGERIRVIPIGVSPDRHTPATTAARRAARDELGIPADADVAAVVGALSPEKDVALAIDAAADVQGLHLVVAGDGPERDALRQRAALRAAERVHFPGSGHDAALAFAAADLVLLTSRTEGLPAVLVEAGMRELPVVATDVGYVNEIVVDGETGVLVEPGSRSGLVAAITRVLEDDGAMGVRARAQCVSRFDLELVVDRWDALLREICAVGAPARSCSGTSATPTLTATGAGRAAPAPRAGSKEP